MFILSNKTVQSLFTLSLTSSLLSAQPYLKVEDIPLPKNVPPEVGALTFDSNGLLYVATRRNDIFSVKPTSKPEDFQWKLFASGFHNACGLESPAPGHLLVTQMAEFTEVIDTDKDGTADSFNNLSTEIGLSGNYHETNALCPDRINGKGSYYIAAGTASHNGPTFWKTTKEYSKVGRRGRNFSAVKWKGWVMHYKNGTLTPFASGFRMPNGIFQDSKGRLWAGDNQGDFRATSPLYLVEKGNFYGHPASLVWDKNFPADQDPLELPQSKLDAMRTPAAVLLPYPEINRSCADPIEIPKGFGVFEGQLLIADNNGPRITRIMLDEVNGKTQGSCCHFINGSGLRSGNNRLEWSPDNKHLYIGQTVRGWGKIAEGLQRLSFNGSTPFDLEAIHLTKTGFTLKTTLAHQNLSEAKITVRSFHYQDTHRYGGPKLDLKEVKVSQVSSTDKNQINLQLESLEAGKVYHLKIENLKSNTGQTLQNKNFYYTANTLK